MQDTRSQSREPECGSLVHKEGIAMKTVSLCMIVKNEEENLARCLNSIKNHVDEIIVVDTGSTDKTKEIAERFGVRLYDFPWNNSFSEARNVSLQYAEKELILILDADDEFCQQDLEKFDQMKDEITEDNMLFYFDTLNYGGDRPDPGNITINPNPRLFSNNAGFLYEGTVHNQLVNHEKEIKHIYKDIRIYHYGYLSRYIETQKKRERNMKLLTEQLKENPEDGFTNFNLGNEYTALGEYEKALSCYEKSYESFRAGAAYSYYLIVRLVVVNYILKNYKKAIEYAETGIRYYNDSTDLKFYHGVCNQMIGRVTIAERSFRQCIEIGDHGSAHKFMYGTGSFKAAFELAHLYSTMKDYREAFRYYNIALESMPSFVEAAHGIAYALHRMGAGEKEFMDTLNTIFTNISNAQVYMANICYNEQYYDKALNLLNEYDQEHTATQASIRLRILVLTMLEKSNDVIAQMELLDSEREEYGVNIGVLLVNAVRLEQWELAEKLLSILHTLERQEDQIRAQVYEQMYAIARGQETKVLSEEKDDNRFTTIIFEILELLLGSRQFELFMQELQLLNLISDTKVLLQLSKLYHKYGLEDMAKSEIIHSMQQFSLYDEESLLSLLG